MPNYQKDYLLTKPKCQYTKPQDMMIYVFIANKDITEALVLTD